MTNTKIFRLPVEKTSLSDKRIYQTIQDKKRQHVYAISSETATCLLEAERGIDTSRHFSPEELPGIRDATDTTIALRRTEVMLENP